MKQKTLITAEGKPLNIADVIGRGNYSIATILGTYISPLSFVERLASVVRPLSFMTGTAEKPVKKTYPIDCTVSYKDCVSASKKHTDLVPNSKYKSILGKSSLFNSLIKHFFSI